MECFASVFAKQTETFIHRVQYNVRKADVSLQIAGRIVFLNLTDYKCLACYMRVLCVLFLVTRVEVNTAIPTCNAWQNVL